MGSKTAIQWTDATWNPILGCSRVSEGCRHCYAETIAGRFGVRKDGTKKPTVYDGLTQIVNGKAVWTGKIVETQQLLNPLRWKKPRRIFVNSMSDLFHENVTDEQRDRIFAVMALCPQHIFQVLTKRPGRMLEYFQVGSSFETRTAFVGAQAGPIHLERTGDSVFEWSGFPLPNVWLGVSVEDQKTADERIPLLLQTPAAVRFLSAEPLIGPINLPWASVVDPGKRLGGIDWVIAGGESGPGARPMNPDWARSLRDQCLRWSVPFFFKQWGEWVPTLGQRHGLKIREHWQFPDGEDMARVGKHAAGALLDGREWKEFPRSSQ